MAKRPVCIFKGYAGGQFKGVLLSVSGDANHVPSALSRCGLLRAARPDGRSNRLLHRRSIDLRRGHWPGDLRRSSALVHYGLALCRLHPLHRCCCSGCRVSNGAHGRCAEVRRSKRLRYPGRGSSRLRRSAHGGQWADAGPGLGARVGWPGT